MIRYDRYPGDYLRDTLPLTMAQDGAYGRLLDVYYTSEKAIPDAEKFIVTRCVSKADRDAVQAVLNRYFELVDGQWVHGRAERELAKAQKRIGSARENGSKGGRPPKRNPEETQSVFGGFGSGKPKPNPEDNPERNRNESLPTVNNQQPFGSKADHTTQDLTGSARGASDLPVCDLDLQARSARWLKGGAKAQDIAFQFGEPKGWPEVRDVLEAFAADGTPVDVRISSDSRVTRMLELFAIGHTVAAVVELVELARKHEFWGKKPLPMILRPERFDELRARREQPAESATWPKVLKVYPNGAKDVEFEDGRKGHILSPAEAAKWA